MINKFKVEFTCGQSCPKSELRKWVIEKIKSSKINNFNIDEQRGYASGLRGAQNSATFYNSHILEGTFSQSIGDIHGGNDNKAIVGYVSGSLFY